MQNIKSKLYDNLIKNNQLIKLFSIFLLSLFLFKIIVFSSEIIYPKPDFPSEHEYELIEANKNYYANMPIIFSVISIVFLVTFIILIFKKKENIKYLFLFLLLLCLNHGFIVAGSTAFYEYGNGTPKIISIIAIFSLISLSYFLYRKMKENNIFKNNANDIVLEHPLKKYIIKFITLNIILFVFAWVFSGYIMDQLMFNEYSTNNSIFIFILILALFALLLLAFIKTCKKIIDNYSFKFFIKDFLLCFLIIPLMLLSDIFTYSFPLYGISFFLTGFIISFFVIREKKLFNFIALAMINFFVTILSLFLIMLTLDFITLLIYQEHTTFEIIEFSLFIVIFSQNILFGFLTGLIPWWIFKKRVSNISN